MITDPTSTPCDIYRIALNTTMRLNFLILLAFLGSASAIPGLAEAPEASVKFFGGLASWAGAALPSSLQHPLAIPAILGLKFVKFGLLKKVPIFAAIGAKKYAFVQANTNLVKAALRSVAETKLAVLEFPFKIGAMKVGAIAGAKAGAQVGLSSFKKLPKAQFIHPMVIPASMLLGQTRSIVTSSAGKSRKSYAVPELNEEADVNSTQPSAEPSTEANTETNTELNTETNTELNTEFNTEFNTELNTEFNTEFNTELNTEPNAEMSAESNNELNIEDNPEPSSHFTMIDPASGSP